MRLIEADKAIEATWEQPTYTDPLNVLTEVRDRIRELPTVEAIPVEWVKKRLDNLNEYIDEHGENHMVLSKIQEAIGLSRLLADWQEQRKEE